jgi:hypothetical protein
VSTEAPEPPQTYVRTCEGYVYFADQGIEVCETCGGCTCCDYADVDHRKARYRCLLDREGVECLLNSSKVNHDCARDRVPGEDTHA